MIANGFLITEGNQGTERTIFSSLKNCRHCKDAVGEYYRNPWVVEVVKLPEGKTITVDEMQAMARKEYAKAEIKRHQDDITRLSNELEQLKKELEENESAK